MNTVAEETSASEPPSNRAETILVEEVIVVEVDEIIEIEEYGKSNRHPPVARGYRIRVDKEKIVFHQEWVTGREILEAANRLPPEKYILREIFFNGPPKKIELHEKVHLRHHGVEKFRTMLKTAQDGQ